MVRGLEIFRERFRRFEGSFMDRNLIAPCPDRHWHVSKILDPRRSSGEKELIALSGKSLLLPQDEAFHPAPEGLEWRSQQLIA